MIDKPHFIIKNKSQQYDSGRGGFLFENILTPEILADVCKRITGKTEYSCTFDNQGYNKGRMAMLTYDGNISFVSFSDHKADGRNKSMQSVPTALMSYYEEYNLSKRIFFYFLPSADNHETNYFHFMYRLMLTAGIEFLNHEEYLSRELHSFVSVEDLVLAKNSNRERNSSNNSSYVTIGSDHVIQIYGKTYGANKYESTMFCIALSRLSADRIELYQICEQNLSVLPQRCTNVINSLGNVKMISTNLTMEREEFNKKGSLRSPRYIYNLLAKLGHKKCALCGCEIPELIQGAHIWSVAAIKRESGIGIDDKVRFATDGDNGIWLCENHHKMLDEDIITIDMTGAVSKRADIKGKNADFITWATPTHQIEKQIMTDKFLEYLQKRYGISA